MILISLYKLAFVVTAFGAGFIAVDIALKKNKRTTFDLMFALMSIAFVIWAAGRYFMLIASSESEALSWAHLLYNGSILVHLFFLHTILLLLNETHRVLNKIVLGFFYCLNIFLLTLNNAYFFLGEHFFVQGVVLVPGLNYLEVPDLFHSLHLLNYLFIPLYALILIIIHFVRERTGESRQQLKWVLFAATLGFLGGNSIVPLVFGFPLEPFFLFLVPFYIPVLAYAIAKHHLFNIKVVTTEIFVFVLWIFILIRIFVSESAIEQLLNGILLLLTVIFGVFLVRSVLKEVEQRERIEKLATDLEKANERLKELDQLKSEFVSMATHQIRGPLAAIKGYASLVLDGDFGEVPQKFKDPMERILQSSQSLVVLVEDYLNISRIEQGRMKYDMANIDFGKLVKDVVEELKPTIDKKGLQVNVNVPAEPVMVNADIGKLKQVVANLIDNSTKYTPQGSISVTLVQNSANKRALLSVSDTGVGIKSETMPKLFQKFSRAEDASKTNILGTGLGLYVAKQMVEAHKGRIWAESEGEGKGSTFKLELNTV